MRAGPKRWQCKAEQTAVASYLFGAAGGRGRAAVRAAREGRPRRRRHDARRQGAAVLHSGDWGPLPLMVVYNRDTDHGSGPWMPSQSTCLAGRPATVCAIGAQRKCGRQQQGRGSLAVRRGTKEMTQPYPIYLHAISLVISTAGPLLDSALPHPVSSEKNRDEVKPSGRAY